jgi:ribonuclease P protein component
MDMPAVEQARAFRRHEHIRRRAEFEAVYSAGVKISGRLMTMFVRENGGTYARLGIAATRKIGGAVVRNRAKRLTREVFRSHKPTVALDIVVVPRREFLDAPYPSLEREFDALLERAVRSPKSGGRGPAGRSRRPRIAGADPRV